MKIILHPSSFILSPLADMLDRFSPGAIGWTVLGIIAALVVFVLFVAAVKGWQSLGSKPSLDEKLNKHEDVLEELKKNLTGLAPQEKVDELLKRLGAFATREEFLVLEIVIQTFITRNEMEDRFSLFQKNIDLLAEEWKNGLTELRTALQSIATAQESRTLILTKLEERSMHSAADIEALNRKFDRQDTKIDRLLERSSPPAPL